MEKCVVYAMAVKYHGTSLWESLVRDPRLDQINFAGAASELGTNLILMSYGDDRSQCRNQLTVFQDPDPARPHQRADAVSGEILKILLKRLREALV